MKYKDKLLNILAIFFCGLVCIPISGVITMIVIHLLEFCGLPINIIFGSTVISVVTNEVTFGPIVVIIIYLLGAFLTYAQLYLKRK